MPKPPSPLQPKKPSRFWLFAPYVAVLVALAAWSGYWWSQKVRLEHAVQTLASRLTAQGYTASFSRQTVAGWPFRMELTLRDVRLAESSGWALAAPEIKGEILPYAPDRIVLAATDGLTLTRPAKGALDVHGRAIRASIGGMGGPAPRYAFEALDVVLTPGPGGQPAPLASAARFEMHLQPGPDDQAALLLRIEGAALAPSAPLAAIEPGKPFDLEWDSRLSHLSALKGANWPAMATAWTGAGGQMTVAGMKLGLGGAAVQGQGGPLTIGPDGRLQGEVQAKLTSLFDRPQALSGPLTLRFAAGRASLGAADLGAALLIR